MTNADLLIGSLALEHLLRKVAPLLQDPDFAGAFYAFSGFTHDQLHAFTEAVKNAGQRAQGIFIQLPAAELKGCSIDPAFLVPMSSVDVRNLVKRDGRVVLTAKLEADSKASFSDFEEIAAEHLKDKEIASLWVETVERQLAWNLSSDDKRKVEAMVKGLFDTSRCPTPKVGEYLRAVMESNKSGEPLLRAAGKALPVIGLPRYEDCFDTLNDNKSDKPPQWRDRFKAQYERECYLYKRGTKQVLLDANEMRTNLERLRADQSPPLPDDMLQAFAEYIDAEIGNNPATKRLLFDFDWANVRHCFDEQRKTSSKDFIEKTRNALEIDGVTPTPEDENVFQALKGESRKSGDAADIYREFFDRHAASLEKTDAIYLEWEDFIHGKKMQCSDLIIGIVECLQRAAKRRTPSNVAYIELEGKSMKTPVSFLERDQRAMEYFERHYASIPTLTGRKVRFIDVLAVEYTTKVLPKIQDHRRLKNSSKAKKANTLQFQVNIFEKDSNGEVRKIASYSLKWEFAAHSVLAHETNNLDALCRYATSRGTTMVKCFADYEIVGKKGIPALLSLEETSGFTEIGASGSRGSFVPAQQKIVSIAGEWEKALKTMLVGQWLTAEAEAVLKGRWDEFSEAYNATVKDLRKDATNTKFVASTATAYRQLLDAIRQIQHEDAKRQLLRIVLEIGMAQVRRAGRRVPVTIITPWHPLRMEAADGRLQQAIKAINQLLSADDVRFSDGSLGQLFFRDAREFLTHPLYPELAVAWDGNQACPRIVAQGFGGYTLHLPAKDEGHSAALGLDDSSEEAATTIMDEIDEYLRLQPHERNNLSVLLYNCDSPSLPRALVNKLNKVNATRDEDKITCQVLLMHREPNHLQSIYKDLVVRSANGDPDPTEATGEFLSKVRINITAASRVKRMGRSQPVDIAYCRDIISAQANDDWRNITRETVASADLQPHRWNRRMPVSPGDKVVRLQLTCPAQTEAGWLYLHSLAVLCGKDADDVWKMGKCSVLMKLLDFDDRSVEQAFRETHDLANWVVNQDELLDRKLLEAQHVKIIRYVQSATHGRNLIISSAARETLLINTLKDRIRNLLPSATPEETIERLCKRFMDEANSISGGLVLRAARRANYTGELLGMVLSRYIVESEIGKDRPVAWCFLDDYSQWLGKKDGASIADLLVLAPTTNADGSLRLDVVVTEAKFVLFDGVTDAKATSAKQLGDTLAQLTEALDGSTEKLDQSIWLARLSDILITQTVTPPGSVPIDTAAWRGAIRRRECSVRVWGYSHVFVYGPHDLPSLVSGCKGVEGNKVRKDVQALQEVFSPDQIRDLMLHMDGGLHAETAVLRKKNDNDMIGRIKSNSLTGKKPKAKAAEPTKEDVALKAVASESVVAKQERAPARTASVEPVEPVEPAKGEVVEPKPKSQDESPVISFLEARSALFESSNDDGQQWLETMTMQLKRALVSRKLPAKQSEEYQPILTPNAGIIKLLGSKELTVPLIESKVGEIYTSESIKIISTTPESGRISIAVERPVRQTLHTEPILLQYLRDYSPETHGEQLLVGVKEEDGLPLFLDPFAAPHTLIAGITGSGKSVLMQNIILSIAASRSPEEAKIYLIDPKFGVDYRPLDELPHVQAGSGGVIDDMQAAIQLLSSLVDEMNGRYELFKQAPVHKGPVNNIHKYRAVTGKPMPTLWVIHDEFADWMQTDEYKDVVPEIVGRLSVKARAAGIFLIFAAQRPDKDVMPVQLRSQLGNRLILKTDNAATAEIAMGGKYPMSAERLLGRGHMLAKIGNASEPIFAQVPFIDAEKTVPELVRLICASHKAADTQEVTA